MNHFHIPKLLGVDKDHHPRDIVDDKCSDLLNVWFKYDKVSRRGGYTNMATLHGVVTGYSYFELMYSSDTFPMVFTTTDVYYYDYTTSSWKFLSEVFTDGHVTCAGGTQTVTLAPVDCVTTHGNIAVSATTHLFKTTQSAIYWIGGVSNTKIATDLLTFSAADTINTAAGAGLFWGIWLIQIDIAGTVSTKSPAANQVYTSSALAIAGKPSPDAGNLELGYILVQSKNSTKWTANTDDMVAGSDCNAVSIVDVTEYAGTWDTSWPAGGQYQMGFGTTDPDAVTTWYTIQSIDTTSQLTLSVNGPVAAGVDYVIRRCYNGNYGQIPVMFDSTIVVDPLTNDSLMLCGNLYDPIKSFDGTTFGDLSGVLYSAKYLQYYHNHTIGAYIRDLATGQAYPQSVMYSVVGNPRDWSGTGSGLTQLSSDPAVITGMAMLKEHLYVFKQMSITTVMYTSSPTSPFDFMENTADIGTACGRTIGIVDNNYLFFLGPDSVYMFDGVNCQNVGLGITQYLFANLNYMYLETSHAVVMRDHNLYCLFVPLGSATTPNYCFVFDYIQRCWTIWAFADRISGTGKLAKTQFFTRWMDVPAGTSWSAYPGTWGGRRLSSGAPYTVLGDTAGGLHKFDDSATDNGDLITSYFVTSDFDCGDPKHAKRFLELVYAAYPDIAAAYDDLNVSCSIDYGNSYYGPVTITLQGTGDMTEHVFNTIQFGKQIRYKIENVSGGDFELEGFVVGFVPTGGGKGVVVPR